MLVSPPWQRRGMAHDSIHSHLKDRPTLIDPGSPALHSCIVSCSEYRGIMQLDPAIRSLIATFRKSPNWDDQLDLELLQQLWPTLAGSGLAGATRVVAIQGTTVVLNVPDLIWRKQLMRMKRQLLKKMNEPWENGRITEIAFTYENH